MSLLKKLAGETMVYGVSSILSRVLQYLLLTPYLTRIFATESYGIHGLMYSFAALLMVLLTYRMETTFFRFGSKDGQLQIAFSTATVSLLVTTLFFISLLLIFSSPIAGVLTKPEDNIYVIYFAFIIGFDVLAAIPFAKLRLENRPLRFAFIKILNIGITIIFTLFFLSACPVLIENGYAWFDKIYDSSRQLDYVFISNLIASACVFVLLFPEYFSMKLQFDKELWKRMLLYALPLIVVGIAGVINQLLDRFLLKELLPGTLDENLSQVGIYNAVVKLAVLMNLFIQAFNYAAEPFFFKNAERSDSRKIYAQVGQAFAFVGSLVFLVLMLYLDIVQHVIGKEFREGLGVVPILLLAYFFLGLNYNFSIWYKLKDRTIIGAYISIGGAIITLFLNILLIPRIGYYGSAFAALSCYAFMALASFWTGKRYYPIDYPIFKMLFYILLAVGVYLLSGFLRPFLKGNHLQTFFINTLLLISWLAIIFLVDRKTIRQFLKTGHS